MIYICVMRDACAAYRLWRDCVGFDLLTGAYAIYRMVHAIYRVVHAIYRTVHAIYSCCPVLGTFSWRRMSVGRLRDTMRCALCVIREGVPADVWYVK